MELEELTNGLLFVFLHYPVCWQELQLACIREYLQGVESLTLQDGPGDAARSPACGIPCPTL